MLVSYVGHLLQPGGGVCQLAAFVEQVLLKDLQLFPCTLFEGLGFVQLGLKTLHVILHTLDHFDIVVLDEAHLLD